jgi:hypothetical protein
VHLHYVAILRLFDIVVDWLMRPKIRRVRRWSFVATLPLGALIAHLHGVQEGAAVVGARVAFTALLALLAWRVGGERGEALRDLLMHPRERAFARAELDILCTVPRLLLARLRGGNDRSSYARGTFGFALALAFTPAVVSEALVVHLLLGGGVVAWVVSALHGYALIWLWGVVLGPRGYPHRVGARVVVLRAGPMYRVVVPRGVILAATARRERVPDASGLVQRDGEVLLPVRGRVDLTLDLAAPVRVQRPLHEPLLTSRLSIACDDPEALIQRLLQPPDTATRWVAAGLPAFGLLDLAGLARDAAQPG